MDRPEDRLALIELLGPDGVALRCVDVWHWPVTIGRALHNTLVLDDEHVAADHARIDVDEAGQPRLTVGPTRNGVHLVQGHKTRHCQSGESLLFSTEGRAQLQCGLTRLQLRWPQEVLSDEKPLAPRQMAQMAQMASQQPAPKRAGLLAMALALWAWLMTEQALALDPGAEFTEWLTVGLGGPLALIVWVLLWATGSKLFRQRFEFLAHARIALVYCLALTVLEGVLPLAAGALGWLPPLLLSDWLQLLGLLLWLRAHALQVLPNFDRALTALTAVACVAIAAIKVTVDLRQHDRWNATAYLPVLPPPMLRWGPTSTAEALVADAGELRTQLEARVLKAQQDAAEEDGDSEQDGED